MIANPSHRLPISEFSPHASVPSPITTAKIPNTAPTATAAAPRAIFDDLGRDLGLGELDLLPDQEG